MSNPIILPPIPPLGSGTFPPCGRLCARLAAALRTLRGYVRGRGRLFLGTGLTSLGLSAYLALLLLFTPATAVQPGQNEVNPPHSLSFQVKAGDNAHSVATRLARRGLIRQPWAFYLAARFTRLDTRLKVGTYQLSPRLTPWEILQELARGVTWARRVTIPEGYSLRDIAALLERQGLGDGQRFLALASEARHFADLRARAPFRDFLPAEGSLEGYLFPDTYQLGPGDDEATLIRLMLRRFVAVAAPLWRKRATDMNLTFPEAVTLASLIEKEAKLPQERPLIASVFLNRLKQRMRLQSCATVAYALGKHRDRLTYRDLQVASPYNTYRHPGLPPGPIANPGAASLQAAFHPARSPYLYFVARGDGGHYFSRNYQEHLRFQTQTRTSPPTPHPDASQTPGGPVQTRSHR